jgi:hypothetical protein
VRAGADWFGRTFRPPRPIATSFFDAFGLLDEALALLAAPARDYSRSFGMASGSLCFQPALCRRTEDTGAKPDKPVERATSRRQLEPTRQTRLKIASKSMKRNKIAKQAKPRSKRKKSA